MRSRPVSGLARLAYRLPMKIHSGCLVRLHLLTVAGAAQASRKSLNQSSLVKPLANDWFRIALTWFPFNSITRGDQAPETWRNSTRNGVLRRPNPNIGAPMRVIAEGDIRKRARPVDAAAI
jgi:hypothetical protein